MLDRAFVSEQQWSSSLESVLPPLPTGNVGWFTNVWSTYSEKRFKDSLGYLDLHQCFYGVAFVTQSNKTDTITEESISPETRLGVWVFIANRPFASKAFIFSVHETRKTHFQDAVRCQQWPWVKLSLYSACFSEGKLGLADGVVGIFVTFA